MTTERFDDGKKGYFKAIEDGNELGKMTYVWAGEGKIIIDHTIGNPDFPGRNVGKHMLDEAVKFARENNLKIIPLCPFAKKMFDRTQEIRDVLVT